ncbi:helix-turn-helix domain-containing protein [Variovorax sp. UMC13]|uniref:helix-turn-helix domain-containing protein n=1 Tax=Variovorax sp. UMC13 TaxID=1862326 RepID=UPI0015FFE1C2|nr:helix-turn-helix domain-containing protein [Variovorax sp. UMC13]MBB1601563.1 hypothetical protein [Variovorax sp. UMC13]
MRNFDEKLLRLKQALGVTSDQEVAKALGMTKAAFSDRKKRDAFPEEKLWALAQREPALGLDPFVILSGSGKAVEKASQDVLAAQLQLAAAMQAERGGTPSEQLKRTLDAVKHLHDPLPADEELLLTSYRAMNREAKQMLLRLAIDGAVPRAEGIGNSADQSITQRNNGRGSIQIGRAKGKTTVKSGSVK